MRKAVVPILFVFSLVANAQEKVSDTTKTKDIETVVVTALGVKRQAKSLTYSAQQIGGDELSEVKTPNLLNAINGKVSNVQINKTNGVGSSVRVVMRGNKSVANVAPLYVIDGIPMFNGNGGTPDIGQYPVKPNGLICSMFRPSDDATIWAYLIPSNLFAVVSLRQASEMLSKIKNETKLAQELSALADEVENAINKYGIYNHPEFGKMYAFEVNGFGSYNLMDDANCPSLLGLPYLDAVKENDPIYQNTRKFVWSENNPFFFKGTVAEGIGGPHIGLDMIWPMSLIMKALTTKDKTEIKNCIQVLQKTHGGTGFMHESFHKNDSKKFTRSWFAWANTLFGELLWKTFKESPELLS